MIKNYIYYIQKFIKSCHSYVYFLLFSLLLVISIVIINSCTGLQSPVINNNEITPTSEIPIVVSNATTDTVTTKPNSLEHIFLEPAEICIKAGMQQQIVAKAIDQYNNIISNATFHYASSSNAGSIDNEGIFTAGTQAGIFKNGISVTASFGQQSLEAIIPVTINPGKAETLSINPITIAAGESLQLEPILTDKYGNPLKEFDSSFYISDFFTGTVTPTGFFTASGIAGTYESTLNVRIVLDDIIYEASPSVNIIPGPLDRVVIAPKSINLGTGISQRFVAVGADYYGNRIPDLSFQWSCLQGGNIDNQGLFTAGNSPGSFINSIKVETTQYDIVCSSTASVIVEQDKFAFISKNNNSYGIYTINIDGTSETKIASLYDTDKDYRFSVSSDGNYIVYGIGGDIISMNIDGTWKTIILSATNSESYYNPSISRDGTKIAFEAHGWFYDLFETCEICIMNIDGSDVVNLGISGHEPSWSPDGSRIAYTNLVMSQTTGSTTAEIYVMDSDGSNNKCLTDYPEADILPSWSPDGRTIAYQSWSVSRWVICTLNLDGLNVTNYYQHWEGQYPSWSPNGTDIIYGACGYYSTDNWCYGINSLWYHTDNRVLPANVLTKSCLFPVLLPKIQGVNITEADVVVPGASTSTGIMTVSKLLIEYSGAVVRIETEYGSGSGFLITSDGLIITNNHVISDAKEIIVYLNDGTSYLGFLINRDIVHDLAVISITGNYFPYLNFGDVGRMNIGQSVVALGYPLDFQNINVTSGVISSSFEYDQFRNITWVQTDCALNPGNSGGPLLNLQGQVVGIVTIKLSGELIDRIGYAISANTINSYLPQLLGNE